MDFLAHAVLAVTGLFFLALGSAALLAPPRASRFLLGFAGSPAKHAAELLLRLLIGAAFVHAAPALPFTDAFRFFGWLLLGTTAVLICIPWRLHHRFAQRSVPEALRYLPLIGVMSLALGAGVLWALWRGGAA